MRRFLTVFVLFVAIVVSCLSTTAHPVAAVELRVAQSPGNTGYWTVNSAGEVTAHERAKYLGDLHGKHLNAPIVGMSPTATDGGYWLVASDGGIFSFGDAQFFGSAGSLTLNRPIVSMSATPSGHGYWLVASDGGIFSFGDAQFYGSTGSIQLNRPIVGMASTPTGAGYWLVATDGGIFSYGDARFFGSTGAMNLNRPVVGMASSASGKGYWLVASDGGIFSFGDAEFAGSQVRPQADVFGLASDGSSGYFVLRKDGGFDHFRKTPTVATPSPTPAIPLPAPPPAPVVPAPAPSNNPFAGRSMWVDPHNPAVAQANAWRLSRPADAAAMDRLASAPTAAWIGDWSGDVATSVSSIANAAKARGKLPVFVSYNIPGRDCGQWSSGGASQASAYKTWIRSFAAGLTNNPAVVVLEPDALAQLDCLDVIGQAARLDMLSDAVTVLSSKPGVTVYLDAGHPGWHNAATMAGRLQAAGVENARGFSLNVSNFDTTADNVAFGSAISSLLGGKHFVVDTSRNGNGSNGEWCNPAGRALGVYPTANTGNPAADAYLWIKRPGESDGGCNGGPAAGTWWADYALGLVSRAG